MQSVASGTLYLVFFGILSKILGFFREMLTAYLFGTSWRMDGIAIALSPITLIASLLSGASVRILIPMYLDLKRESGESARELVWNVLIFMAIVYGVFGFILLSFPRVVVEIFAPGFPDQVVSYTARKLRYLAFLPIVTSAQNVLISVLRAERRFREYAISSALFNVFAIPVIYAFAPLVSEASYVLGWIVGNLAIFAFTAYFSRDLLKPSFKPFHGKVMELFRKTIPLTILVSLATINNIVDKAFVSLLPSGRVASLRYSQILVWFISAITGYFTMASYTELSERSVEGDIEGVQRRMRKTIERSLNITVPGALWTVSMAESIVRLVYERGAFTSVSTNLVSSALVGYSLMIVISPTSQVLNDFLILKERFRLILGLGLFNVATNAFFDWILLKPFQHAGVALSTSLVTLVALFLKGFAVSKYGIEFMPWRRMAFLFALNLPVAVLSLSIDGLPKLILGNTLFAVFFYISARDEIRFSISKVIDFIKRKVGR